MSIHVSVREVIVGIGLTCEGDRQDSRVLLLSIMVLCLGFVKGGACWYKVMHVKLGLTMTYFEANHTYSPGAKTED